MSKPPVVLFRLFIWKKGIPTAGTFLMNKWGVVINQGSTLTRFVTGYKRHLMASGSLQERPTPSCDTHSGTFFSLWSFWVSPASSLLFGLSLAKIWGRGSFQMDGWLALLQSPLTTQGMASSKITHTLVRRVLGSLIFLIFHLFGTANVDFKSWGRSISCVSREACLICS